jgi:hypothetical protein
LSEQQNEAKGKTTCQRMNYRRESGIEIESSGNRSMPRTWPKAVAWITEGAVLIKVR